MPRSAAFFDLDKTLMAGSSGMVFARVASGHGMVSRRQLARWGRDHIRYRLRGSTDEETSELLRVARETFKGVPEQDIIRMAPEVLAGEPASVRTDIYSVGVLLYHLVTGGYPVEGGTVLDLIAAHREGRVRRLSERRQDLPLPFVQVVTRALAPNPADRWPTAGAMLEALADAADGGDGVDVGEPRITFELSADFVGGVALNASSFVTDMASRGHGIGVHADIGGQGYLDLADFTLALVEQRDALEALGVDVVHVSGICSPSQWVEAAINAGFDATTGMVEFCLSSYPGAYPMTCGDAANECHGAAVTDWEHKLHPWRTSTSTDWLTHDDAGELLLVAGESGTGVHCMSEHAAGSTGRCRTDDADIPELISLIDEFVAAREPGRLNVLTLSWSIGGPPSAGFADDLFAAVASSFDATELAWATLPEIVAAA